MRIVSQCGQADFPYERTYILSDRENVKAVCDGKSYVIGRYSTHEKAIKAMEMCRKRYTQYIFNRRMVTVAANDLTRIPLEEAEKVRDQISETFIFQFPKEEEVEDE